MFESKYFSEMLSWANVAVAAVSESIAFFDSDSEKVGIAVFSKSGLRFVPRCGAPLIGAVSCFSELRCPGLGDHNVVYGRRLARCRSQRLATAKIR